MTECFHWQLSTFGYGRILIHIDVDIFEGAEISARNYLNCGDSLKEYESSKLRETLEINFSCLSNAMSSSPDYAALRRYKDLMEGCSRFLMGLLFHSSSVDNLLNLLPFI
jgi:hypothetical protein